MVLKNLKDFADEEGIVLPAQEAIVNEARDIVMQTHHYSPDQIKEHFDDLLAELQNAVYALYLKHEKKYGEKVFKAFVDGLVEKKELSKISDAGDVLGKYFNAFDKFFLSLSQARKSKAGKSFEDIHNELFKTLNYPFSYQAVINGKPDFLMPSKEHYARNPMECVIFTSKRTLRERWRQIVTEGTRGLGFYLATIDEDVSEAQLKEMLAHRIHLVVPNEIKERRYPDADNVLSFKEFFLDHLDPKLKIWKRKGIVG